MSDDFEGLADNFFKSLGDVQPTGEGVYQWNFTPVQPIEITLTPEQIEYIGDVLAKVAETFRNFLDEVARAWGMLIEQLKTLGFFEMNWAGISVENEAAEIAHARRFNMYQRRYARGKA